MRSALKVRTARALRQLELAFPLQRVVTPCAVVGQPLRLPICSPPVRLGPATDALALQSLARELLRALGAEKLAREVQVEWNPRMRTCAGRADYREKLISLNPLLRELDLGRAATESRPDKLECYKHSSATRFDRIRGPARKLECNMHSSLTTAVAAISERPEQCAGVIDEIDRTLRHELAHLLAQWRVGRRRIAPHGPEWRQACVDLGIADEARCHNLPFASKSFPPRYVYRCPNCKQEFPRVRRIRRAIACLACCRAHNRGEFDSRFRLRLIKNGACPP
jgi:predicted SprT family Zn-dependent metalloprotease